MPTYDLTARFERESRRLTPEQRAAAKAMLTLFLAGLRAGRFDPRLRVHRVRKVRGVWEITWAPDGRATFEYGDEHPGEPHIHWRRIGDHDILQQPWSGSRLAAVHSLWIQSLASLDLSAENETFVTFLRHHWSSMYGAVRERDLYREIKDHVKSASLAAAYAKQAGRDGPSLQSHHRTRGRLLE